MHKRIIGIAALIVMLTGCGSNAMSGKTSLQESIEPLIDNQTYKSLDALAAAFEPDTASNVRLLFDDEKVYYLSDDNIFGASMQEVQVNESYFNCIYEDGIMLITNRFEDGRRALEHMTANNSEVFSKKQTDGMEYYYTADDETEYYLWIQGDTYVQLNVPVGSDIGLGDVVKDLEYRSLQ